MKFCNTIDGEPCNDRKVRHLHLTVIENRHLLHFLFIARIHPAHFLYEAAVDLLHIHQKTHQFCNCYCRMRVVHLEDHFLMQTADIVVGAFVFLNCLLKTCRDEEILLF